MNHYLFTNRPTIKKNNGYSFRKLEGNDISGTLNFGQISIKGEELKYNLRLEEAEDKFHVKYPCAENEFSDTARFFYDIYKDMRIAAAKRPEKRDIMLFIHGFGHDTKKSFRFLRELDKKYVQNENSNVAKIIMFMWPSKNHFLSYDHEQEDAEYCGGPLTRFYIKLKKFLDIYAAGYEMDNPGQQRGYLHLVVQSMGNMVLQSMVEKIVKQYPHLIDNVFKEIILVGADVSSDVFEPGKPLEKLCSFCSRVHVYYHKEDTAMKASKLIRFIKTPFRNKMPLGKTGPSNYSIINNNIKVVDVSDLEDFIKADSINDLIDDKIIQHRYFMYSTKVVKDIICVLNGHHSEEIEGRKPTATPRLFRL